MPLLLLGALLLLLYGLLLLLSAALLLLVAPLLLLHGLLLLLPAAPLLLVALLLLLYGLLLLLLDVSLLLLLYGPGLLLSLLGALLLLPFGSDLLVVPVALCTDRSSGSEKQEQHRRSNFNRWNAFHVGHLLPISVSISLAIGFFRGKTPRGNLIALQANVEPPLMRPQDAGGPRRHD